MSYYVRCVDSKHTIKQPQDKRKAVAWPASRVCILLPHESVRGVRDTLDMWHDGTNKYYDHNTRDDQKRSNGFQDWKRPVCEHGNRPAEPCYKKVCDKDVPPLRHKVGVEQAIHRHYLGSDNLCCCGESEDPSQEVPPAREEAANAAIAASSDWCPVIHLVRVSVMRYNRKGWLDQWNQPPPEDGTADASSAIEAAMNQEKTDAAILQDRSVHTCIVRRWSLKGLTTHRSRPVDPHCKLQQSANCHQRKCPSLLQHRGTNNAATQGKPGVSRCQCKTTCAQQPKVAMELLGMAGGIDRCFGRNVVNINTGRVSRTVLLHDQDFADAGQRCEEIGSWRKIDESE